MNARIRKLNLVGLGISLTYALLAIQYVKDYRGPGQAPETRPTGHIINPLVDFLFIYVTSAGLYLTLINLIQYLVGSSQVLLRIYWGRMHVSGLWSYVYTVAGDDTKKEYFGIWRFVQDLYGTTVIGYGLTDEFTERSRVRSLTDLTEYNHQFEVVNVRTDHIAAGTDYYSRTTMFFELGKGHFFRRPDRMTGQTFVFGGPLSGRICSNTFLRHPSADTEHAVIEILRANFLATGHVHGTQPPGTPPGSAG